VSIADRIVDGGEKDSLERQFFPKFGNGLICGGCGRHYIAQYLVARLEIGRFLVDPKANKHSYSVLTLQVINGGITSTEDGGTRGSGCIQYIRNCTIV
jgi:hypothetical protein